MSDWRDGYDECAWTGLYCTVECDAMYAPGGTIGPCPHPLKKADDDPEPF